MSEKRKTADTEILEPLGQDPEEYVSFTAPFSEQEWDTDLFLSVNGENVRVKRGETVKIKRKFVEVYENAMAQQKLARENRRKARMAEPVSM